MVFFWGALGFSQNVLISEVSGNPDGHGPNEPSIAIDPNNTDVLVVGTILNDVHRSNDGGRTWTTGKLESSYGVWGDPVIDVGPKGNFYYFHLSNTGGEGWIDRIVCQKSTDQGKTWNDGTFTGLNGTKDQDKQWSVIDRNNGNIYLTWTQFDKYGSDNPACESVILFSKSLDEGDNWSEPVRISSLSGDCQDGDQAVGGAVPAVGPNGEVYVVWAGPDGILFNRSLDQGETWLEQELVVDTMPGGWNFKIPGISRTNGFPVIKCDLSGGPNQGTLYVNWSDQRNGEDNTDIWFSRSTDGGFSWTEPVRVNDDDTDHHQFFTWMDIDQANGHLHFIFYDRRNFIGNRTEVYLAHSLDGGETFINRKISESPFVPNGSVFFGDYNNITAHDNIVRPVWTRLHEGNISVWTDITPFDTTLSVEEIANRDSFGARIYPNPLVDENLYVAFKLRDSSKVTLEIYDPQGKLVKVVFDKKEMAYGVYNIPIDLSGLNLKPGLYYSRLTINDKSRRMKTLMMR